MRRIACLSRHTAGALLVAVTLVLALAGPAPAQAQKQDAGRKAKNAKTEVKSGLPRVTNRRDPFRSLFRQQDETVAEVLPPGKRGLVIGRIRIDGLVAVPTARLAVVSMKGRNRAYFLREGDELFDGYVFRISDDGVVFRQRAQDAFGKTYEREVLKQLSGPGA
ncbi:MAG: hypothetical protein ACE5HB_01500 [Terriglobia bacterium]